jgi:O-antigen/teichoic acid export membrane protein
LIPRYRFWGAIAATGAAFLSEFVGVLIASRRVRRMPFPYRSMAKAGGIAVAVWGLYVAIPAGTLSQQWAVAVAVIAAYPVLLIASGIVEPDEKRRLRQIATDAVQRLRSRRRR